MKTLHCLPLRVDSMATLQERLLADSEHADMIEIWLDSIKDLRLAELFFDKEESRKPFIIVNKSSSEGGMFMGSEEDRIDTLIEAAERGAEYIDVGLQTEPKLIKKCVQSKGAAKIILSYHNFKETPSLAVLKKWVQKAKRLGADIVKIATFVEQPIQNIVLFELMAWAQLQNIPTIVLGMGEAGKITRLVGPLWGAPMYFAPLRMEEQTAQGQMTADTLKAIWGKMDFKL